MSPLHLLGGWRSPLQSLPPCSCLSPRPPGQGSPHTALRLPNRPQAPPAPPPTVLPAVPRLVAVGDLHGDLEKARQAFRIAGLVDERDRWVGGTTTVVQVGDVPWWLVCSAARMGV